MGNINDIPILERPYEKLEFFGPESLSDSELLSIIINSGTKLKSSIEIAQDIINLDENGLRVLIQSSIEELCQIDGIGCAKAIRLKAVGEIAKRILNYNFKNIRISNREEAISLVKNELLLENREILKLVLLNNQNYVIRIKTLVVGSESNIAINIKQILNEIIRAMSPKVILAHNHPSGNSNPSKCDIDFTNKIKDVLMLLDVELLDHIIISKDGFKSI